MLPLLTLLLLLPSIALAFSLTITIPSSPLLPNPNLLPPTTHATLVGPSSQLLTARLSRTNTLTFPTLAQGSHLLHLYSRDYTFPPFRVDVGPDSINAGPTFRGHEWGSRGPSAGNTTAVAGVTVDGKDRETALFIEVRPLARRDFFAQREGFSVMGIFKNPMILMALFSGALIFGMPYLVENMDDETRAEFEEAQKKGPLAGVGGDAASSITNFDFASWMAGKTQDTPKAPAVADTPSGGAKSLR